MSFQYLSVFASQHVGYKCAPHCLSSTLVWGTQTQILTLVLQAVFPLSHLPSPNTYHSEMSKRDSPSRELYVRVFNVYSPIPNSLSLSLNSFASAKMYTPSSINKLTSFVSL